MQYSFFGEWVNPLGWTLVHSLWQAAILAFVYHIFLRTSKWNSRIRHNVGLGFLLVLIVASILTFVWCAPLAEEVQMLTVSATPSGGLETSVEAISTSTIWQQMENWLLPHLGWLSLCWGLGLLLMSIRLLGGWWFWKRRIIGQAQPLPEAWENRVAVISERIGLATQPVIKSSERILVPAVVGVLRPVIVLPVAMLSKLDVEQAEAVLLHEMTHILRKDHWMNFFQSVVETIYYFNPFVWSISASIRKEREHCCDDKVVEHLSGGVLVYAKALLAVEMLDSKKGLPAQLAIGLLGKKQVLLERIQRLVHGNGAQLKPVERAGVFTSLLMLFGLVFLPWQTPLANTNIENSFTRESVYVETIDLLKDDEQVITIKAVVDTLPAGNFQLKSNKNGERVELKSADGKIILLRINGKEIPQENYDQYETMVNEIVREIPPPPPPPSVPGPPTPPSPPTPPNVPTPPAPPTPSVQPPAPPSPPYPGRDVRIIREMDDDGTVILEVVTGDEGFPVTEAELERLEDERYHPIYLKKEATRLKKEIAENYPDGDIPEEELERITERLQILAAQDLEDKEVEVVVAYLDTEEGDMADRLPEEKRITAYRIATDYPQDGTDIVMLNGGGDEWWVAFLLEKGLIDDPQNFRMKATSRYLKVNGNRASPEILQEFLKLYEIKNGQPLTGKSSVSVNRSNSKF